MVNYCNCCHLRCLHSYQHKKDEKNAAEQQKANIEYTRRKTEAYKDALVRLSDKISTGQEINKQPIVEVVTIGYNENIHYLPHYIWTKDNMLYFFPTGQDGNYDNHTGEPRQMHKYNIGINEWKLISVPIDKIMFYRQIGSVYTTTTGSGGHSSFSPITGFHGKINPIEIKSRVHDERTTQIFYDDGTTDKIVVLDDKDYYVLRKLIPKKDYQIVTISESVSESKSTDEFERLKKINEMHKAGLISDSDFEQKKAEILGNI